jgi:hypothetical protein
MKTKNYKVSEIIYTPSSEQNEHQQRFKFSTQNSPTKGNSPCHRNISCIVYTAADIQAMIFHGDIMTHILLTKIILRRMVNTKAN